MQGLLVRSVDVLVLTLFEVFVCVAALAILDRLDEVDDQTLGWWLAERQLPNGGLNGRPEKLEDVGAYPPLFDVQTLNIF